MLVGKNLCFSYNWDTINFEIIEEFLDETKEKGLNKYEKLWRREDNVELSKAFPSFDADFPINEKRLLYVYLVLQ